MPKICFEVEIVVLHHSKRLGRFPACAHILLKEQSAGERSGFTLISFLGCALLRMSSFVPTAKIGEGMCHWYLSGAASK